MSNYTGTVVLSLAGHDKGGLFYVLGCKDNMLQLVNGKQRKLASPKRKKSGHVQCLSENDPAWDGTLVPHSDPELRRRLAAFKEGITLGKR